MAWLDVGEGVVLGSPRIAQMTHVAPGTRNSNFPHRTHGWPRGGVSRSVGVMTVVGGGSAGRDPCLDAVGVEPDGPADANTRENADTGQLITP